MNALVYSHFNNSLFYNEYIVILTFLFVATILSVVIALFSYLLAVQKLYIKELSTFARQGLVTKKSSFDLDSKSRDAEEPEPTLVIDVSARTNVNPRSMFFKEAVNAQAYRRPKTTCFWVIYYSPKRLACAVAGSFSQPNID